MSITGYSQILGAAYDLYTCCALSVTHQQQDLLPTFSCFTSSSTDMGINLVLVKGPVKPMQPVKIAHSFLQPVTNQFHVIILSVPV